MLQEQRDPAGRDERARWIGRHRYLAVPAFRVAVAVDECELSLRERALRWLAERHVDAHALVVAVVVEVDAEAQKRLVGALLEPGLNVHVLAVPDIGAMHDVDASERPVLERLAPLLDRRVDELVVLRRRVVVRVAAVLAAHDARHWSRLGTCPRDSP